MSSPIPASPIAQPTPKIGTRYVAVQQTWTECGNHQCSLAVRHPSVLDSLNPDRWNIYALLDPADAAELERLRKVEDEAANRHIEDANLGTPEQASASFAAWVKVRDERIAFEKKIGGGK
jgi:hypothetical protein